MQCKKTNKDFIPTLFYCKNVGYSKDWIFKDLAIYSNIQREDFYIHKSLRISNVLGFQMSGNTEIISVEIFQG